uniref:PDZ domain-containing protein n=1 Tax=Clostridium symbiosum TaxID=1512 RepID=UPI001FAAEF1F
RFQRTSLTPYNQRQTPMISGISNSNLRERDIITKFDGETVRTGDELQKMLTYYKGGTSVTLTVQSLENGSYVERQIPITLGYKKDSQKQEVQEN